MKTIMFFAILIFLGFLTINFSSEKSSFIENYAPTIFPKDTTQLWLGEGSMESDTVLLINEGGPKIHLSFEFNEKTQWAYLPNYFNYYRANLHQVLTFNKEIVNYKNEFTVAMAEKEVDNNSEILYRAFEYFKKRGKTVIVIGHSFGAFTIPHCMATRPLEADKYLISAGRIDDNLERSSYFLKGYNSQILPDGKTFIPPDTTATPNRYRGERYFKIYRVKQLLKGVIGQPRYSKELANRDLSNMIYFYATNDENVGALTDDEIEFLETKGAMVFATEDGHYEVWKKIVDAFENGTIKF